MKFLFLFFDLYLLTYVLIVVGIEPYVTIYNWDMPSTLEDSMDGWLNPNMVYVTIFNSCKMFNKFVLFLVE